MSLNAIRMARQKFQPVRQEFIAFDGGIDLETPPLFLDPGFVRDSLNWESDVLGGYVMTTGYERFSGKTSPSDANYAVLGVTISGAIAAGDTVTGATSGATGVVLANVTTYIVITKIVGTFVSGENLTVSAVVQAVTTSAAIVDGASTPLLHAQYKNLAADNYRADIAAPTGSGSGLGVVRMNGVTYTFRNNAGGTAADIWRSTASGWQQVALGSVVSFTGGNSSVGAGDTLTQGGVTATIKKVIVTSGTSPNLVGRLIIHTVAGGNFAAGAATSTGGGALTLDGAESAITIQPNGSYEFIVENFGGSTGTKAIYGIDGVNKGFEFDGSDYSYAPIVTGMTTDVPTHLHAHKNHLFFSFAMGSVQHSAPAQPFVWSVILGASEIGMGDEVMGFMSQPGSETGGALSIYTRNRTSILYGNGVSTWVLVPYNAELGAYASTIQEIGFTVFLDDHGITDFKTVQAFGNFKHATLSERIETWLTVQRTKVTASCISRDKSQYRLFFSDLYALYVTFRGRKVAGMMQMLFSHQVKRIWSSEESDGSETIFFTSTNGMVYQMERGTSFDGDAITHHLYLAFDNIKSPRLLKAFKEAMLEVRGSGYTSLNFTYELGYGDTNISQPAAVPKVFSTSTGQWDSGTWDGGFWDSRALNKQQVDLGGTAENISLMFRGSSDYDSPIKLSGALVHFIPRRNIR